jgi:hypothetical protein
VPNPNDTVPAACCARTGALGSCVTRARRRLDLTTGAQAGSLVAVSSRLRLASSSARSESQIDARNLS